MNRYDSFLYETEGETVCRLQDRARDCRADIAVTFGMNVIRYLLQGRELILSPPSLAALKEKPFRYGIPILCPPGLTSGGAFEHRGKRYELPVTSGKDNVHGAIGRLPWSVRHLGADPRKGAFIQAEYRCPHERVRFLLTYRLQDGSLALEGAAIHEGEGIVPFALGFHPYFLYSGARHAVDVQIPARSLWPRNAAGSVGGLPVPSPIAKQLREGLALDRLADDLYCVECGDGSVQADTDYICKITDRDAMLTISYRVHRLFSKLMLFLPGWANAVSLEPHSCVPDAFNLALDESLTGVRELSSGEARRFGWTIEARLEEGKE